MLGSDKNIALSGTENCTPFNVFSSVSISVSFADLANMLLIQKVSLYYQPVDAKKDWLGISVQISHS